MTTPHWFLKDLVRYATPGVGMGPKSLTFIPTERNPAWRAASSIYPETLVSLPINTVFHPSCLKTIPAAYPIRRQASGVTLVSTGPLIPSVPNFRLINLL